MLHNRCVIFNRFFYHLFYTTCFTQCFIIRNNHLHYITSTHIHFWTLCFEFIDVSTTVELLETLNVQSEWVSLQLQLSYSLLFTLMIIDYGRIRSFLQITTDNEWDIDIGIERDRIVIHICYQSFNWIQLRLINPINHYPIVQSYRFMNQIINQSTLMSVS